jgi:hypothetical protein
MIASTMNMYSLILCFIQLAGSMDQVAGIRADQIMMDFVLGAGALQARLWEFQTRSASPSCSPAL